ncbi:MAG: nucleotidyl transferase AbiEii/AbiGii toxin family protein [Simkaniaceae bacterium]|nr:nucleotidyl transferase AbiEii/AbiGii toxin family protein [Simkaniaceae bacterium]
MTTAFKTATDFRKSLEARLKNISEKTNQDLQRVRRKVAFERLLARIFYQDADSFVLKGGYAMELRFSTARATKDIDLTCLHRVDSPHSLMETVIIQELRELAKQDLHDYFTFEVGESRQDLENAPYGGARYSVSSFVDRRLFVRFQLDVGADVIVDQLEEVDGVNWLAYCGIKNPRMRMISIEQQFAEKLHAYSLPREDKFNSRVKDLIDMLLFIEHKHINKEAFVKAVDVVFKTRKTHLPPKALIEPPAEWINLFEALTEECGIQQTMKQAFDQISQFYSEHFSVAKR